MTKESLPPAFFERLDPTPDAEFYAQPRFVAHIDAATIAALSAAYRELLPAGGRVLDLMSSWISHLPADISYAEVTGLGLNAEELAANPRLHGRVVHDLNADPTLPFAAASYDAVVNAVSIQYLTRPVEVFREVARVLVPGGLHIVATSHRMFPTKAIRAWHTLAADERLKLIAGYFERARGYEPAELQDRSPLGADPLWLVMAKRSG
ncbi:MAG: class I SAM-dependent methyltransferase [Myxococcales bacterium]|nr:class I SAM-dependent methyltransferase [Myxococcales bacterium]